jgi:hypothetical protein
VAVVVAGLAEAEAELDVEDEMGRMVIVGFVVVVMKD